MEQLVTTVVTLFVSWIVQQHGSPGCRFHSMSLFQRSMDMQFCIHLLYWWLEDAVTVPLSVPSAMPVL